MSPFHFCLSAAKNLSSFRLLPASLITDLLQLFLGLLLFLFPWGFQSRAAFGISPSSFLNVWPNHLNFLFLISKFISSFFIFLYFQLDTLFFRLRTISAIPFPLHVSCLTGPSSGGLNCTCSLWYSPPLQMSLSCGLWERTFSTAARQRHLQRGRIP